MNYIARQPRSATQELTGATFHQLGIETAAMETNWKQELERLLADDTQGVNARLGKIMNFLQGHGLAYTTMVTCGDLLCHPGNRGGGMVNPHDCHRKGTMVVASGLNPALLPPSSIAIEMSRNSSQKAKQIEANQKLVASSSGMLGQVTNNERFLTVGNSHFIGYLRALQAGAKSPEGEECVVPQCLAEIVQQGWKWLIVKSEVEESCPGFPSWVASTLNSTNAVAKSTNEVEAMMEIANHIQQGRALEMAVKLVKEGQPAVAGYLTDVAYFVKVFCGGSSFPLLMQMKDYCTLALFCSFVISVFFLKLSLQAICSGSNHGPSLRIGEEMMNHLAHYDFRMGNEKLPMCRFALMVAMLTSKRHADGLARLIVKADLDKMKGQLKDKCTNVEKLLLAGWEQCQRSSSPESVKTTAFGHLAVRLVLHLLGKEKWGREDGFESFPACVEQFGEDLKGKIQSSSPSAPEEGSSGVVTDLLTAKPKEKPCLHIQTLQWVAGISTRTMRIRSLS